MDLKRTHRTEDALKTQNWGDVENHKTHRIWRMRYLKTHSIVRKQNQNSKYLLISSDNFKIQTKDHCSNCILHILNFYDVDKSV